MNYASPEIMKSSLKSRQELTIIPFTMCVSAIDICIFCCTYNFVDLMLKSTMAITLKPMKHQETKQITKNGAFYLEDF